MALFCEIWTIFLSKFLSPRKPRVILPVQPVIHRTAHCPLNPTTRPVIQKSALSPLNLGILPLPYKLQFGRVRSPQQSKALIHRLVITVVLTLTLPEIFARLDCSPPPSPPGAVLKHKTAINKSKPVSNNCSGHLLLKRGSHTNTS